MLGSLEPPERVSEDTCRFLGTSGCELKARPFLCFNYDCRELCAAIESNEYALVRGARRELLDCYLRLEAQLASLCELGAPLRLS